MSTKFKETDNIDVTLERGRWRFKWTLSMMLVSVADRTVPTSNSACITPAVSYVGEEEFYLYRSAVIVYLKGPRRYISSKRQDQEWRSWRTYTTLSSKRKSMALYLQQVGVEPYVKQFWILATLSRIKQASSVHIVQPGDLLSTSICAKNRKAKAISYERSWGSMVHVIDLLRIPV